MDSQQKNRRTDLLLYGIIAILVVAIIGVELGFHHKNEKTILFDNVTMQSVGREAQSHKQVTLFFLNPTCSACKKTYPVIKKEMKHNHDHPIYIVNVKSKSGRQMINAYNVERTPSAVEINNSKVSEPHNLVERNSDGAIKVKTETVRKAVQ